MRVHLLGLVLLAGIASPAAAQRGDVERRLERIEAELRAVQRRVFPGGAGQQWVEPEIRAPDQAGPGGVPAGDALSGLTARVDALESQLRTITGQTEENGYRLRQIEDGLESLRSDVLARLERLESRAAAAEPVAEPVRTVQAPAQPAPSEPAAEPAATPPAAADAVEEAYNAGYRLWNAGRYAEAQEALSAVAERNPDSRWASWARNLAGRAFLDDGKPANAARIFVQNYQSNPRGERAADSLYFLGIALTQLDRRSEACQVYAELEEVYPDMRDFIRQRLPAAKNEARC